MPASLTSDLVGIALDAGFDELLGRSREDDVRTMNVTLGAVLVEQQGISILHLMLMR